MSYLLVSIVLGVNVFLNSVQYYYFIRSPKRNYKQWLVYSLLTQHPCHDVFIKGRYNTASIAALSSRVWLAIPASHQTIIVTRVWKYQHNPLCTKLVAHLFCVHPNRINSLPTLNSPIYYD